MKIDPQRGEVWMVYLDPTRGAEMQNTRPCVIVGSNAAGWQSLRIIVPFTDWKPRHALWYWMIKVIPDHLNGLANLSAADTFQIRSVSIERMREKVGCLSQAELHEIVTALAAVVEYTQETPLAVGHEDKPLSA